MFFQQANKKHQKLNGELLHVYCWNFDMFELKSNEIHVQDSSQCMVAWLWQLTSGPRCALVLFMGAGLYCVLKTPKTVPRLVWYLMEKK